MAKHAAPPPHKLATSGANYASNVAFKIYVLLSHIGEKISSPSAKPHTKLQNAKKKKKKGLPLFTRKKKVCPFPFFYTQQSKKGLSRV